MNDFLDLRGASGSVYRFRRVGGPAQLPAEGGNFAYVKEVGGQTEVIHLSAGETLHQARDGWDEAVKKSGAEAIFVRLNISSQQRLAEHEDLTAAG